MESAQEIKTSIIHRSRIEIIVISLLVIICSGIALLWVKSRTDSLRERFFLNGKNICIQLGVESGEFLLENDELSLNNVMSQAMSNPLAVYALLVDHEGIIRAHSNLEELDTLYVPNSAAKTVFEDKEKSISASSFVGLQGDQVMDFASDVNYSGFKIGEVHLGLNYQQLLTKEKNLKTVSFSLIGILLAGGFFSIFILDKIKKIKEKKAGGLLNFGPYRLIEQVGVGGMAEVYRGKRVGLEGFEKTVAIKRILPHLSNDQRFQKMFLAEAKNGAKLNHPNIVQIYDVGNIDGVFFIAMEFMKGKSLAEVMKDYGKPFSLSMALFISTSIARGLAYAHQYIAAHRDINPHNIFISYLGEAKIMDFGISKALEDDTGRTRTTGLVMGKLAYMSPEQVSGISVDHRTDIFALGVIIYEMLTGKGLFSGDNEMSVLNAINRGVIPPLDEARDDIPTGLADVVHKALQRDINARYQTTQEISDQLEQIAATVEKFSSTDMVQFMKILYNSGMEQSTLEQTAEITS